MDYAEAFAALKLVQDYVPLGNSNRPGKKISPSSITIHNTDNPGKGANAAAHAKYMKGPDAQKRQVSWHYTVDDEYVYQSIPTTENTWHSSTKQGNNTSISIEICMNSDLDEVAAYERAEWLVAVLCYRNGFNPKSQVVQHHDWSGKNCPSVIRAKKDGWIEFVRGAAKKHASITEVKAIALNFPLESAPNSCELCS